jgi:hypothetical protein
MFIKTMLIAVSSVVMVFVQLSDLPMPGAFLQTNTAFALSELQLLTTDADRDGKIESATISWPDAYQIGGGLGHDCAISDFGYLDCAPGTTCEIPLSLVTPGYSGDVYVWMWGLSNNAPFTFDCQIVRVDPTPPVVVGIPNGFPLWYQDVKGLALQLCLDQTVPSFCVLPTAFDPARSPGLLPITTIPGAQLSATNFPAESFYWVADVAADVNVTGGSPAGVPVAFRLRMVLEAAFGSSAGIPVNGQQIVFMRIDLQKIAGGLVPGGVYTVSLPFGSGADITFSANADGSSGGSGFEGETFLNQAGGAAPLDFVSALPVIFPAILPFQPVDILMDNFLIWDPAVAPAAPAGYIGDPAIGHAVVKAGDTAPAVVTMTGPGLPDDGVNFSQFFVGGKVVSLAMIPPASGTDFGVWKFNNAPRKTFTVRNLTANTVTPVITAADTTPPLAIVPQTVIPAATPFGIVILPDPIFTIGFSSGTPCSSGPLAAGATCTFDMFFNNTPQGIILGGFIPNAAVGGKVMYGTITVSGGGGAPVQMTVIGTDDNSAPSLAITQIARNTKTTGQPIAGTVSDNTGVASVQVSVNGGPVQAATVSGGTWTFNVTGLGPNSANTIAVSTSDIAQPLPGNMSLLADTITVDNTAPAVAIAPLAATTSASSVAVTGSATDNNSISSVSVRVNGTLQGLATVTGTSWSFSVTDLAPNVASSITATATDPAGNATTSTPASITFVPVVVAPADGDMNMDGTVTIADALMALRAAVSLIIPTTDQMMHGNVTPLGAPDNRIDISDALMILRKAVHLVNF